MVFDSWCSNITRYIMPIYPAVTIYMVSLIVILGIVMINVIVAVVLDKMTPEDEEAEQGVPPEHRQERNRVLL